MRKAVSWLLALFAVLAMSVVEADNGPSGAQMIAITNYGPTPPHIFSEFPLDYSTVPPTDSGPTETPGPPVTRKPTGRTPAPNFIVDAPMTRPPQDSTLYGLRPEDFILQTLEDWQYELGADGNAVIIGFADKNAKAIVIPEFVNGIKVTAIKDYAFSYYPQGSGYPNLSSVVIPDSVINIGQGVFYQCSKLTDVTLPKNIDEISPSLFSGCKKLKRVNIPDRVKTIGYSAFSDCDSLDKIELPDSLTEILYDAFISCDNLKTVLVPDNVDVIQNRAFEDCVNLQKVTLPAGDIVIGRDVFKNCGKLTVLVAKDSKANDYAVKNKIPFEFIKNLTADNRPDVRVVEFYAEPDGKGKPVVRGAGFSSFYYVDLGFKNDALSSVRINSGELYVKLYEHSEYGGTCLVLQGKGLHNLEELRFDDICSSYSISK